MNLVKKSILTALVSTFVIGSAYAGAKPDDIGGALRLLIAACLLEAAAYAALALVV